MPLVPQLSRLVLIGMSGLGKSYWSHRLAAEAGYHRFGCDDEIERSLVWELERSGNSGDVAAWLGQPFTPRYGEREQRYLEVEHAVMERSLELLSALATDDNAAPHVIDTSGSVIYMPKELLMRLRSLGTVVLLDFTMELREEMFRNFMAHPRPVIWGGNFCSTPGTDLLAAVTSSYPALLAERHTRYRELADVVLPYELHRQSGLSTDRFLQAILSR